MPEVNDRCAMVVDGNTWTGIGAVGTFVLGVLLFREAATLARFFFVGLIVAGIVGLKLVS